MAVEESCSGVQNMLRRLESPDVVAVRVMFLVLTATFRLTWAMVEPHPYDVG